MSSPERFRGQAGATHLRPGDVLVALVLLGLLLFAAWKQFPTYNSNSPGQNTTQRAH